MVVLSAAVLNKGGKVLVARQFVEISRMRIEGLYAAFPKLISSGKQHTFVETDTVRYVYQPMDALFLVLVTNKTSNIIEDLETLRLLSRVVPEYCDTLDDAAIQDCSFELIFAFDEVLSLGYRENVTLQQIRTYTQMDSHEEKLHNMIRQSKINEAKDIMNKKVAEMDQEKKNAIKMGRDPSIRAGGISSRDSTPGVVSSDNFKVSAPVARLEDNEYDYRPKPSVGAGVPKKGMKLGKSAKTTDFLSAMKAEGEYQDPAQVAATKKAAAAAGTAVARVEDINIICDEKLNIEFTKEGNLVQMEIKGDLTLRVTNPEVAACRIHLSKPSNSSAFQFKSHPKVDKDLFGSEDVLGLKSAEQPFPVNNDVGLLKWRLVTDDDSLVPLKVDCWFSSLGSQLEYELTSSDLTLSNVVISFPMPEAPTIASIDGESNFDAKNGMFEWRFDTIDNTNKRGVIEFETSESECFPVNVSFTSSKIFSGLRVTEVTSATEGTAFRYSHQSDLCVDRYVIGLQ